jgi:hypothetical protein
MHLSRDALVALAACTPRVVARPQFPVGGFGWWGGKETPTPSKSVAEAIETPKNSQTCQGEDSFGFEFGLSGSNGNHESFQAAVQQTEKSKGSQVPEAHGSGGFGGSKADAQATNTRASQPDQQKGGYGFGSGWGKRELNGPNIQYSLRITRKAATNLAMLVKLILGIYPVFSTALSLKSLLIPGPLMLSASRTIFHLMCDLKNMKLSPPTQILRLSYPRKGQRSLLLHSAQPQSTLNNAFSHNLAAESKENIPFNQLPTLHSSRAASVLPESLQLSMRQHNAPNVDPPTL